MRWHKYEYLVVGAVILVASVALIIVASTGICGCATERQTHVERYDTGGYSSCPGGKCPLRELEGFKAPEKLY